jgi:hypothetical protein
MKSFAKVRNGKVIKIIIASQDFIDKIVDTVPGRWIECRRGTKGNKHYKTDKTLSEDQNLALRGNYPSEGYNYDNSKDVFYPPQPFNSWTLNSSTFLWDPPVSYPNDGKDYSWNENTTSWDLK